MSRPVEENCEPDGPRQAHCQVTIANIKGLHATAAAKFVRCVENFHAEVNVRKDGATPVDGDSIMGLLMLGASMGTTLQIEARGPEASDVVQALARLVAEKFNEEQPFLPDE